jgi:type IV pilus assembly protein PilW
MAQLKTPPPPRGFTLIELLVGAVTTTIILSAVAVTIMGVQASYQTESRIKVAVESLRTATNFIEQRMRMAGYGVEPRIAFDFL